MKRQNMQKSLDLQYNGIRLIKVIKDSKARIKRKSNFFLNSFSVDEKDDFSELL